MSHRLEELTARIETLAGELEQLKGLAAQLTAATEDAAVRSQDTPAASRRDLLRYGAAALGAAAAAGMATAPVEAADGGAVIIGASNIGSGGTLLTTSAGNWGFYTQASNAAWGIIGNAHNIGVAGLCGAAESWSAGVQGSSAHSTGAAPGVAGFAYSPNAPAVYGSNADGGNAVRAEVPANATSSAIALYALNYSSYTGGTSGAGGFAIYGLSAKGHGLVGATAVAGGAAVVGATNSVAGAYAAAFYGPVIVSGNFTVVGGAKSAAVPHPDGSHRRLYCVESPESWFEDFGRGTLACGEATVPLDPDFAAIVDASDYHVFLTGYDGRSDLFVCDCSAEGFRVCGSEGAEGTFSWRVVAKRKDIAGARLERVEMPKEPTLPPVPDSVYQEMPTPPDLERMAGRSQRPKRKA